MELTLLMAGFIVGSSILLPPGRQVGNMGWLAILLGVGEGLIFAFLYTSLMLRFPGKTMVEIVETVYGGVLGKLMAVAFIYYLFHLGSFVVRNFLDFIKLNILVETPASVILFVGLIVCGYAARSGIEVLGRCSQSLVIFTIILFLFSTMLLLHEIHPEWFLPLFTVPIKDIAFSAHAAATFPFGETVAFMMALPFINQKKETGKTFLIAFLISGSVLVVSALRSIGVMGKSAEMFMYPSFYVAKLIDVGDIFTRMEILVSTNFLIMGFLKISVLLYGASLGTAQIFRLSDYRPVVFPLGVLMYTVAMINFNNVTENAEFANVVYPIYSMPFILGIPLLTLVVAHIRGLPKKGAASHCGS